MPVQEMWITPGRIKRVYITLCPLSLPYDGGQVEVLDIAHLAFRIAVGAAACQKKIPFHRGAGSLVETPADTHIETRW